MEQPFEAEHQGDAGDGDSRRRGRRERLALRERGDPGDDQGEEGGAAGHARDGGQVEARVRRGAGRQRQPLRDDEADDETDRPRRRHPDEHDHRGDDGAGRGGCRHGAARRRGQAVRDQADLVEDHAERPRVRRPGHERRRHVDGDAGRPLPRVRREDHADVLPLRTDRRGREGRAVDADGRRRQRQTRAAARLGAQDQRPRPRSIEAFEDERDAALGPREREAVGLELGRVQAARDRRRRRVVQRGDIVRPEHVRRGEAGRANDGPDDRRDDGADQQRLRRHPAADHPRTPAASRAPRAGASAA